MIKELWTLVKMLFASRPSDYAYRKLEVVEMKHVPFKGYKALAWCGRIIHRKGSSKVTEITMNHEMIHVVQAMGCNDSWARYYLTYLWEWLKHCPWMSPSSACYYLNKFECEAYANEENPEYLEKYDGLYLDYKYTIKNAKKLYKKLGGTSDAWKRYVKSL